MQRRKVCRYFEKGSCKKDKCPFVHIKQNRKNCLFYLEGYCKRGEACNFYHPPKETEKLQNLKKQLKDKKYKKPKKQISSEQQIQEKQEQQEQKVEEIKQEEQKIQIKEQKVVEEEEKIGKINFLIGINEQSDSEDQASQFLESNLQKNKESLQFTKIFPKKFVDYSKNPQVKKYIQQNQQKYFKQKKFLVLMSDLQDPIEKQYYQIIRKFQDSFFVEDEQYLKVFQLRIRPLLYEKQVMLHFQFKEERFEVKVCAENYPQQMAKFTILNQSIPIQYKQKLEEIINKIHTKKNLFQTLKSIQNNFEKIYQKAKFILQSQFYSKKEIQRKMLQEAKESQKNSKKTEQKIKKPKKIRQKQCHQNVQQIKYKEGQKVENMHFGYELRVESLHLQNCQYIVCQKILLYIECICQDKFQYIFDASDKKQLITGIKLHCKKCQNLILVGLEREVAQVRREVLGRIGVDNGLIIDVGGIGFKVGCSCDNEVSKSKLYLPGQKINMQCHFCFQSMFITFLGLTCFNPNLKESIQIQPGKELPNKGTCKHMKLSFRWLRYGCCGRCFSCDDCHLINGIPLHQKIKGITMLCGFCSREQPIAQDCAACKKQVIKGVDRGGHWEGGMGCRDQTLLSKKDAKKYSGLTKKK